MNIVVRPSSNNGRHGNAQETAYTVYIVYTVCTSQSFSKKPARLQVTLLKTLKEMFGSSVETA